MKSPDKWGGCIEIAVAADLKNLQVLVYKQVEHSSSFIRIASFGDANAKTLRLVYQVCCSLR
jgi:hypothetical protein